MLKENCGHGSLSTHEGKVIFYPSSSIILFNLEGTYIFCIHLIT